MILDQEFLRGKDVLAGLAWPLPEVSKGSGCLLTLPAAVLMFKQPLRCCSSCPLPLLLSPGTAEESLAPPSSHPCFSCLYTLIPPELALLQAQRFQLSQPLLIGEMLWPLHHLSGFF